MSVYVRMPLRAPRESDGRHCYSDMETAALLCAYVGETKQIERHDSATYRKDLHRRFTKRHLKAHVARRDGHHNCGFLTGCVDDVPVYFTARVVCSPMGWFVGADRADVEAAVTRFVVWFHTSEMYRLGYRIAGSIDGFEAKKPHRVRYARVEARRRPLQTSTRTSFLGGAAVGALGVAILVVFGTGATATSFAASFIGSALIVLAIATFALMGSPVEVKWYDAG